MTDGETDNDETLTYAELDHAARALAVEILKVASPGDRGILMYPPGLDFIIGFFVAFMRDVRRFLPFHREGIVKIADPGNRPGLRSKICVDGGSDREPDS